MKEERTLALFFFFFSFPFYFLRSKTYCNFSIPTIVSDDFIHGQGG